jgi:hypothetical protein
MVAISESEVNIDDICGFKNALCLWRAVFLMPFSISLVPVGVGM